ncbi:MAG: SH3 domain-containing protein [Chloroflexi bacterium]|nr:SH3 domain-containing protein [Chloroflexota bacterium]
MSKRVWLPLLGAVILAAVSLSCSVGQAIVGRSASGVATATKTPRPTFTPLAGATASATAGLGVRGPLPPGVSVASVEPAGAASPSPTPLPGAGSTNLILFATETPPPNPTPRPTGTPEATATATPDSETNRPTLQPGPRPLPTPYVVVNADAASGRKGPGVTFPLLGEVSAGTELKILARTPAGDWWQVCCIANQPAWVSASLVTALGPLEGVPMLTPPPTPAPTAAPPPTATPSAVPTRLPPFDIAAGPMFPIKRDTGELTIWVKVYEGPSDNQKPLTGYVLKVSRDDVDVSSPAQSRGPYFNYTKPEGNFEYNLDFKMDNAGEAKWRIYLAKPDGYRVSPISEFTTLGDSYRNLVVYVAYWLAR